MIPEKYNQLADTIEKVIQFSQGLQLPLPGTTNLISQWRENKEKFFHLFGDSLEWESSEKVSVKLTDSVKLDMINTFLAKVLDELHPEDEEEFISWIEANKEGFFNNRIIEELPLTPMKKGGKLLKAFKYFFKDKKNLRKAQDLASQFIQQDKIDGYLCLSIHPLDYLTASENNSNWRSCHALDGEYRAGNLSYMLDKTTIICYLRPPGCVQLKNLPEGMLWNDKKWRMFLSINENNQICFFNRQYPFSSEYLLEYIIKETPINTLGLGEINYKGFKTLTLGTGEEIQLDHNYLFYPYNDSIIDTRDICKGDLGALNYNDIVNSPTYTPVFALGKKKGPRFWELGPTFKELKITIGVPVPCLSGCGNLIDDSDGFLCDDCFAREIEGQIGYCSNCGDEIYKDDIYKITNKNKLLCCECLEYEEE